MYIKYTAVSIVDSSPINELLRLSGPISTREEEGVFLLFCHCEGISKPLAFGDKRRPFFIFREDALQNVDSLVNVVEPSSIDEFYSITRFCNDLDSATGR